MLGIILAPHPNSRYRQSELILTEAELRLSLHAVGEKCEIERRNIHGVDLLAFEPDSADTPRLVHQLGRISTLLMLVELRSDGSLLPVSGASAPYLGEDISGILKYKGKTNEVFTRCLLNIARLSGAFAALDGRLCYADPVCGRGTALLEALRAGDDAFGVDCDARALDELRAFLKRYMTYHRLKHGVETSSLTVNGKPCAQWRLSCACSPEDWKAGDTRSITLVEADTTLLDKIVRKPRFHAIVGDLPYGVQHAGRDESRAVTPVARILSRALPAWRETLLPGGAVALSFNSYTLGRDEVRDIMARSGYRVLSGGVYDTLGHWVEQAVNRDVAVGVREV